MTECEKNQIIVIQLLMLLLQTLGTPKELIDSALVVEGA